MEEMLLEIKAILFKYEYLDGYDGFQVIAEIWKNSLTRDIELISKSEFYIIAKMREPNMVTRGSGNNKREEQDGWVGSLIPNELIREELYKNESLEIEELKQELMDIETELEELVEGAKIEDSEENEVLFESFLQ